MKISLNPELLEVDSFFCVFVPPETTDTTATDPVWLVTDGGCFSAGSDVC